MPTSDEGKNVKTWTCRFAAAALGMALGVGAAHGEVAAVLDQNGAYLRTEVNLVQSGRLSSVWLASEMRPENTGSRTERVLLNTQGAQRADGAPSVVNHPLTGLPWAVWAFNEGGDYELAFSFFDGRDWAAPILLGEAPNGVDDVEPQLVFSDDGRPIIAWGRVAPDGSSISIWLTSRSDGQWQDPVQVSSPRRQASHPSLLLQGTQLILAYDTDRGVRIRILSSNASLLGSQQPAGGHDGPDPPTKNTRSPECPLVGCLGN
ncbi:MAG: hypothetical protein ACE5HD_02330 [Acidobacteriota bacterium]